MGHDSLLSATKTMSLVSPSAVMMPATATKAPARILATSSSRFPTLAWASSDIGAVSCLSPGSLIPLMVVEAWGVGSPRHPGLGRRGEGPQRGSPRPVVGNCASGRRHSTADESPAPNGRERSAMRAVTSPSDTP
jgi:hypothetical protein